MWSNPSKNTDHLMLDLGSGTPEDGEFQPPGFVLNDVESHPGIDLVCNVSELDKHVKLGQCRVIRASHVLEHFGRVEVERILKMLYELLEPGGMLHVMIPNFQWHAHLIMQGRDEEAENYAFGGQKDEWDYHKSGWTPKLMGERLRKAGFSRIRICVMSSMEVRCVKE